MTMITDITVSSKKVKTAVAVAALALVTSNHATDAFAPQKNIPLHRLTPTIPVNNARRNNDVLSRSMVSFTDETTSSSSTTDSEVTTPATPEEAAAASSTVDTDESTKATHDNKENDDGVLAKVVDKIGKVDDSRVLFPEYSSGEVPRMFSSLEYKKQDGKTKVVAATHLAGSTLGAAALVTGTTVGAGVLALPTATAAAGFLPSSAALAVAWWYMTMSGLLIAELSINRMGNTGRPGQGILELYKNGLGSDNLSNIGSAAYFFLHYAIMVAYIAQGGANFDAFLEGTGGIGESLATVPGIGQILFAAGCGSAIYFGKPSVVEKANNVLVAGVMATFIGVTAIGAQSCDFEALINPINQHPEEVVNAFPILFLSMVYQNVVPTVVNTLEGDRHKITTAIIAGTTMPFLMFLAWNGVILGNVMGTDAFSAAAEASNGDFNPVALLQSGENGGPLLSSLVGIFSELALITSLTGFVYGLLDALTDVTGLPSKGPEFEKWKPALFAGVLVPPLALSLGNPDIFYNALDYGGAFGVSTLFLVLPPLMVWKERYGDEQKPIMTKPMVPLGKLSLGSMWKAAGTLIFEQGAEKLGVFDFIQDTLLESLKL